MDSPTESHDANEEYAYLFWEAETVDAAHTALLPLHDHTTMVMSPKELKPYLTRILLYCTSITSNVPSSPTYCAMCMNEQHYVRFSGQSHNVLINRQ